MKTQTHNRAVSWHGAAVRQQRLIGQGTSSDKVKDITLMILMKISHYVNPSLGY